MAGGDGLTRACANGRGLRRHAARPARAHRGRDHRHRLAVAFLPARGPVVGGALHRRRGAARERLQARPPPRRRGVRARVPAPVPAGAAVRGACLHDRVRHGGGDDRARLAARGGRPRRRGGRGARRVPRDQGAARARPRPAAGHGGRDERRALARPSTGTLRAPCSWTRWATRAGCRCRTSMP